MCLLLVLFIENWWVDAQKTKNIVFILALQHKFGPTFSSGCICKFDYQAIIFAQWTDVILWN